MNTGEKVTLLYFTENVRSIKKGDLFRVIDVSNQTITLAAIDEACLRDDEMGARTKEKKKEPKKPKELKKRIRSPKQKEMDMKARVVWMKRSVLQCLAVIDKENKG